MSLRARSTRAVEASPRSCSRSSRVPIWADTAARTRVSSAERSRPVSIRTTWSETGTWTPSSSEVGGVSPLDAITRQSAAGSSRWSRDALVTAKVSRMRSSMAGRASSPRRTELASRVRVSASARARAASLVRRAALSTTIATATATATIDEQGGGVARLGDGQRVGGFDEEVVQGQPADQRGHHGGRQAADQGDCHGQAQHGHGDQAQVVGVEQGQGQQGRAEDGQQPAGHPASGGQRGCAPREAGARGLVVGDDDDVDVAAAPDHSGAGAGEQGGAQRSAAGLPDHDLGGVDAAGELQERVGDVLADDVVEGAAEGLDQGALAQQRVGGAVGQAVARGDVDGQQVTAATGSPRSGRRGGSGSRPRGRR